MTDSDFPDGTREARFFARPMRMSDIDFVVKNEKAAYPFPWSRRIFTDCIRAGYQCWVMANKKTIVAHGVLSVAIGESHLLTLCVHPSVQREGYGRKVLSLLLERAKNLKAEVCFLEVRRSNIGAISLYESMGFSVVSERKNYYPNGGNNEDALIMTCEFD
ncbi:ribosomal protein S18-alanine N-acetyltransferase [bacterium]|nr:ribosomal protein S18-alanine N-acetyltransferase [bacterium]